MTRTKTFVASAVLGCLFLLGPLAAQAQDVVANPADYDFFTVYIGDSATATLSLTNVNGGTVSITHAEWIYNPLTAFEVTSGLTFPAALGSGESVDYQVTFTPPDFSFWNARLVFYTNSATTPSVEVRFWGFGEFPPTDPCAPLTECGGVCVDTNSDIENCGGCGTVCADPVGGEAFCDAGVCVTDCGGLTDCDGVCLDLDTDVDNCGACGSACTDPAGGAAFCAAGVCANDCGSLTDCGGICLDTDNDVDNCGACGAVCSDPDNGTALCDVGMCGFDCDPGYVPDGAECVPEVVDERQLLVDLLQFYDDSIADGSLVGVGGNWWVRVIRAFQMRRHFERALLRYDQGRIARVCFRLDRAYLRTDGVRSPRDWVEGPAADDMVDRILEAMSALGCS